MLLRRVISHVGDQNWTAIGIDFVIVVIGVFVGLQVTSWNEDRIAKSRTATYYQRFIDDLQTELNSRESRIEYYELTRAHAEAALLAMQTPGATQTTTFLIDAYQASQRWMYAPQRTTYDELVASGIADAIPDVRIRTLLANLYVSLETSELTQREPMPYRDELRRHMSHAVQNAIRENCNDRYSFKNGQVYIELPETCEIALDENLIADAVDALSAYEEMEMDLTRHISILDSKLNSLRATKVPLRQMMEILQAQ